MSDTIAAISTSSLGSGGIGIVRISGDDAINIADKVFIGKNGKKLSDAETHTIHYGNIRDEHDNIVDEVLVSVMKAPNTYTREDVIEINTHGGNLVTGKVLECVLNAGAIAAEWIPLAMIVHEDFNKIVRKTHCYRQSIFVSEHNHAKRISNENTVNT